MKDVSRDFEAIGDVLVVSEDGRTLRTERLSWVDRRQRIVSEDFVTMTTADGDTLQGDGFESDQSLNYWTIRRPKGVTNKAFPLDALEEKAPPDSLVERAK